MRSAEALDQRHRRGRIAYFVTADDVEIDVARFTVRGVRPYISKTVRHRTGGPGSRACGPKIKRSVRVTRLRALLRAHDAGIDERRSGIGNLRVMRVAGNRNSDAMLSHERDKIGMTKTLVSNLDDVT
jgi:hypothetical protein